MVNDGKTLDTNIFFSGGAGMFIQYHDVIKPVYLYSIIKMMLSGESFGLPIDIIKNMSIFSIIEWYIKRRFKNPLRCLDFQHILNQEDLDKLMHNILIEDDSIYRLSPLLNIQRILHVYRKHQMTFPIYVYSELEEPYIQKDCSKSFQGISVKYLYGDLEAAIKKCDQNFTYIFSDIELVKLTSKILTGTCSHVLLANDYRYNYIDNYATLKYDLRELALRCPFIRTGLTQVCDLNQLAIDLAVLIKGGSRNAST